MIAEWLLGAAVIFGCGGTPMNQQVPVSRSRSYQVPVDTLGVEGIVAAPADRVWQALGGVYADLGLEVNFREPAARRVGTCYQKLRTRLGGEMLSTFVECGESRGAPNADRYEIALTVLTTVESTGPGSAKVYTFVLGVGLDATGTASNRLWCYTKGVLEERIRQAVEAQLRG
jgi:hypothetical protein